MLGAKRAEYLNEQQTEGVYVHLVVVLRRLLHRQIEKQYAFMELVRSLHKMKRILECGPMSEEEEETTAAKYNGLPYWATWPDGVMAKALACDLRGREFNSRPFRC